MHAVLLWAPARHASTNACESVRYPPQCPAREAESRGIARCLLLAVPRRSLPTGRRRDVRTSAPERVKVPSPIKPTIQRWEIRLADRLVAGGRFARMPDPRTTLTAQELIYASTALRAEARRAELQAADPAFESSRPIFEQAAKAYDALAGKLTRIAERLAAAAR